MDTVRTDAKPVKGKLPSFPGRLLRPGMVLPILSGRLMGKRWIVGAGPHSCWLGTYEREKQALFSKTVSREDTVFDIGGNAGFYTLLASRRVGRHGKVYAFEPLPRNLETLQKHLELNKCSNVSVIEAALSYKNGFAFFDGGPGGERAQLASSGQQRVWTCTLDTLLELGQIPLPDIIRMDIGGGEFAALCGAKTLLSRAHPTIFLSTHGLIPHRECCAFLEMLGYRLAGIGGKPLEQSSEILATHFRAVAGA
jgi:FkbM family methyltransferase